MTKNNDIVQEIVRLRNQKFSYKEISKLLNLYPTRVRYWCIKLVADNDKIIKELQSGLSDKIKRLHPDRYTKTREEDFTNEEFTEAIKNSVSIAGTRRILNTKLTDRAIRKKITELKLDISHFTGSNWKRRWDLRDHSEVSSFKSRLARTNGHKCQCCHMSEWQNQPIPLQLHHKDGDYKNNDITNLMLICPNCHAQKHDYIKNWVTHFRDKSRKYSKKLKDNAASKKLEMTPANSTSQSL